MKKNEKFFMEKVGNLYTIYEIWCGDKWTFYKSENRRQVELELDRLNATY